MADIVNYYCRFCAKLTNVSELVDLQSDEEKNLEVTNKLIKLNAGSGNLFDLDILPKTVCYSCISSLEHAFNFVLTIEQAQNMLMDLVMVRDVKNESASTNFKVLKESRVSEESSLKAISCPERAVIDSSGLDESSSEYESTDIDTVKDTRTKKARKNISISKKKHNIINRTITWKEYGWLCSLCNTAYLTIKDLQKHAIENHATCNPYKCTDCGKKKLSLSKFILHIRQHNENLKLSCHFCYKKFRFTAATNTHIKSHSKHSHTCIGCNESFKNSQELEDHVKAYYKPSRSRIIPLEIETQIDGTTCPVCMKTYSTKGSLTVHVQTQHMTRKRSHVCETCGRGYYSRSDLTHHMQIHSTERLYQCHVCKASFKQSSTLRYHMVTHNEKRFSCEECGHRFHWKKQLQNHQLIHTDSLPHVCGYCNKAFRFKGILNIHLRQHTGDRPYSCDMCNRTFTNWSNKSKHMKRIHNIDIRVKKRVRDPPIDKDIVTAPKLQNVPMHTEINLVPYMDPTAP